MNPALNLMACAAAAALLGPAFAPAAYALQVGGASGRSERDRLLRDAREREERERERERENELLMALTEQYHRAGERRDARLAFTEIREDFLRLQVVNNDLARAASQVERLDLKLIARSSAEIKKRAERLKFNLALPEMGKSHKPLRDEAAGSPEQLQAAVSLLDGIILRFVKELHTQGIKSLDAQSSARTQRDLNAIIALSERVKKSSEKLEKAARNPQ